MYKAHPLSCYHVPLQIHTNIIDIFAHDNVNPKQEVSKFALMSVLIRTSVLEAANGSIIH